MSSEAQLGPAKDSSPGFDESQGSIGLGRDWDGCRGSDDFRRILAASMALLSQGEAMLTQISVDAYTRRHPVAFNASIGGHYRHCLDHFTSLLRSRERQEVNYDQRERDVRIESEPAFALVLTRQLQFELEHLPPGCLASTMRSRCSLSDTQEASPVTGSTFGRELVYAIAHAIHHFALIAIMARLQNVTLPEHFGVAPSTLKHNAGMATQ